MFTDVDLGIRLSAHSRPNRRGREHLTRKLPDLTAFDAIGRA